MKRKVGAGVISDLIGAFGLGNRRRVKRRVQGAGLLDVLKKGLTGAHRFVKDNRLISRGLRHFVPREQALADFAERHGYGKPKRRVGGAACKFN